MSSRYRWTPDMGPVAVLAGTDRTPEVHLLFERGAVHAKNGADLVEWVKKAPRRYWDGKGGHWTITAFGGSGYEVKVQGGGGAPVIAHDAKPKSPERLLTSAGFRIVYDPADIGGPPLDPSLETVLSLDDLIEPLCRQSNVKPVLALVRPRFAGWDVARAILGPSARWDKETQRFEVPLTDLIVHGNPKKHLEVDKATVEAARNALLAKPKFGSDKHDDETLMRDAAVLGASTGLNLSDADEASVARLVETVGDIPAWFDLALYPYQRLGAIACVSGRGFLADPPGLGKGSPNSTRILTPTGWTTYGEIGVGDQVIGSDGKAHNVIGVYPRGELDVYRVTFNDGSSVVVDGDHLWSVRTRDGRAENRHPVTLSTRTLMSEPVTIVESGQQRAIHFIPLVEPIEFAPQAALPLDPYVLGLLIGDGSFGSTGSVSFTSIDEESVKELEARLPQGHSVTAWERDHRIPTFGIKSQGKKNVPNLVSRALLDLGLRGHRAWEKFIPQQYLFASAQDRLELLRGLCDTDGTVGDAPDFVTTSKQLALDVQFLIESLGGTARMSEKTPTYRYGRPGEVKALKEGRTAYRVGINLPRHINPFRLSRKANAWDAVWRNEPVRSIKSIEPEGRDEVTCIAVDAPDALYVTERCIVTHNTRQILAAFANREIDRAVLIVPPVVLTNWAREAEQSALAVIPPPPKKKPVRKAAKKAVAALRGRGTTETALPVAASKREAASDASASLSRIAPPTSASEVDPDGAHRTQQNESGAGGSTELQPRHIVMFKAGRKEPDLPERGLVIVPDSLLSGRPELRARIAAWGPDAIAYDEIHRIRNWESKRTQAILDFVYRMRPGCLRIGATGTPLFANPAELVPLLAFTGHLDPVFGGAEKFISRYCKRNFFNALVANPDTLDELREILYARVWVRRDKKEVLKDLPPKARYGKYVDVDLSGFRAAHDEVIEKIMTWLDAFLVDSEANPTGDYPSDEIIKVYARQQIGLMSPLRKAAGLAKVPIVFDLIKDWIDSEVSFKSDRTFVCDRPLLLWAHHQEVVQAMVEAAKEALRTSDKNLVGVIDGGTSADKRGRLVDQFQAGQLPILICSISAAGVGITLTRGSDAVFVETSPSLPEVSQAEDRQSRIGQTVPTSNTTLLAAGTFDEHLQRILVRKAEIVDAVTGDKNGVAVMTAEEADNAVSPATIIESLVHAAIERHEKEMKAGKRAA